jgi:hypothetical protein
VAEAVLSIQPADPLAADRVGAITLKGHRLPV